MSVVAVEVGDYRSVWSGSSLWRSCVGYGMEMCGFLLLFGLYYLLRAAPADDPDTATRNALQIIRVERNLGLFREPAIQDWSLHHPALNDLAKFTYSWLHQPVLFVAGFLLFHASGGKYRAVRNALLFSGFAGVFFYWFIPVTPPRLLLASGHDLGFVDTLAGVTHVKPGALTNDYAAIPSYHFGWILLICIGTFSATRSRVLRVGSVLFLAWMAFAIVATANHYFLDMAIGGVMVVVALAGAVAVERAFNRWPRVKSSLSLQLGPARFPF